MSWAHTFLSHPGGVHTQTHQDGKTTVINRVQDVEPVLERNKELQKIPQRSEWFRHTATIPNVILEQWLQEEWSKGNADLTWSSKEFEQIIRKKLADPDWKYLKVIDSAPRYVTGASLDAMK
jgi:hypothetical protein